MSIVTHTVYAPGLWVEDIQSAMESWEIDFESAQGDVWADGSPLTWRDLAMRDQVLPQFLDATRIVKRGRRESHRFDLTFEGVKALRREALYRFEFHGGNGNAYGSWDPEPAKRNAALVLMRRCEAIVGGV
jgi:hypothetical protein